MSWSPKSPRIIRAAPDQGEVFVLGRQARESVAAAGPVADAIALVAAAEERARQLIAEAEREAAGILQKAESAAAEAHQAAVETARTAGYDAGRAAADQEAAQQLEVLRIALREARQLRDQVANDAAPVIARAVMLATRRIVGEYYAEDPQRTVAAVREALQAAAGQDILRIRVNPGVFESVTATLGDSRDFVASDDAVAIGGCILDLREGTLDASLDARLNLMELALQRAGGEVAE